MDEDIIKFTGGIPARSEKGERLLLFLGVIDILQQYKLKKKMEHAWKAAVHDGNSVRERCLVGGGRGVLGVLMN